MFILMLQAIMDDIEHLDQPLHHPELVDYNFSGAASTRSSPSAS
jgi:hypothetical protein